MGNSKDNILQSIREHKVKIENVRHCEGEAQSNLPPDPLGGEASYELTNQFKQSLITAGANFIEVKKDSKELKQTDPPILHGNFGVAENGAIWLEDKDLSNRLSPFIVERLTVSLDIREIVPTMQDAYRRIDLKQTGFGVFISGPSKTADIEQSLVYGAHGAKEMTVMLN